MGEDEFCFRSPGPVLLDENDSSFTNVKTAFL